MSDGLDRPQPFSPEVVNAILKQATDQLEIRKRELEIQDKQTDGHIELSKLAVTAQAGDLESRRKHERDQDRIRNRFILSISLMVLLFLGFALYAGKEQFAADFFKLLMGFLMGGGAGYWYGKAKTPPPPPVQPGGTG